MKEDTNNTMVGRNADRPAEGMLGVDRAVFRECLFGLQRIECLLIQGDDEGQTKASRRRTLLWRNRVNQSAAELGPWVSESILKCAVSEEDGD